MGILLLVAAVWGAFELAALVWRRVKGTKSQPQVPTPVAARGPSLGLARCAERHGRGAATRGV
jgi:hypothetical protein